jgi:hypothetical protein
MGVHESRPACQLRQFTQESAWPMSHDWGAPVGLIALRDIDLSQSNRPAGVSRRAVQDAPFRI